MTESEICNALNRERLKRHESFDELAKTISWNRKSLYAHLQPTENCFVKNYNLNLISDIARHFGFTITLAKAGAK